MTEKEYKVQKALGLADRFLLELVVRLSCNRKEVEEAVAKYSYNPTLLKWRANTEKRDSRTYGSWITNSYIFDVKCPFEAMSKIRTELKGHWVDSQMTIWSTDQMNHFLLS